MVCCSQSYFLSFSTQLDLEFDGCKFGTSDCNCYFKRVVFKMTRCKIEIKQERCFDGQGDAKFYLRGIVNAGCLFINCSKKNDQICISVNETTRYKTQADAKIDLKKLVDAGILYLNVDVDKQ